MSFLYIFCTHLFKRQFVYKKNNTTDIFAAEWGGGGGGARIDTGGVFENRKYQASRCKFESCFSELLSSSLVLPSFSVYRGSAIRLYYGY